MCSYSPKPVGPGIEVGFSNLNVWYMLPVIKLGIHQLNEPKILVIKLFLDQYDCHYILFINLGALLPQ